MTEQKSEEVVEKEVVVEKKNEVTFNGLGISDKILSTLKTLGFTNPTPIQHQAIPIGISGKDLVGIAQTGTGKTLAFGIPMLQRLAAEKGKGLVLLPTRELAVQVEESFRKFGFGLGLNTVVLIGGENIQRQFMVLKRNPQIIVATPGRLNDHLVRGSVNLSDVKVLVLDEADLMFDMGFAPQINKIIAKTPKERQTMLFSATMPPEIIGLATANMKTPLRIEVAPAGKTADGIDQEIFLVKKEERFNQLEKLLKEYTGSVLIFCRTKRNVKTVADKVIKMGHKASEIHSNRSQSQRQQALNGFKRGMIRVLVATDIAARGIDVSDIQLVVNFDLPDDTGDYVHRIGRTARAGKTGKAVSFAAPDQIGDIRLIERLIRKSIPVTALGGLTKPAFVDPTKGPYSSGKRRMSSRRPTVRGERGEPRYLRDEKKPFARKSFDNTKSSFSKPVVRPSFGKASLGENTFAPKKESFVTPKPSEFAAKKEFSSYPKRESSGYPKRESSGYPKRESSAYPKRESGFGDRSGAPRRFNSKPFGAAKTSGFVNKKDAFSYDKRETSYPKRESSYGDRSSAPRSYGAKRFGSSTEGSYGAKREGGYGAKREGAYPKKESSYGDRSSTPRSYDNKKFGSSSASRPAYKRREDSGSAVPAPKLFSDRERFRASMRPERPSFGAKRSSVRKPSYR